MNMSSNMICSYDYYINAINTNSILNTTKSNMSLIESTGALLISGGIGPPKDNAEYTVDYLKIISSIQKGETMSTSSMRTIDHNSWYSAIWRRIRGENRIETIEKIKSIYLHYLDVYRADPSEILYHSLLLAREGISNLEITYNSDVEIIKIIRDIPHPEKIVKCDVLNIDTIEQNNSCRNNAVIIEQNISTNETKETSTNHDKMDVCDTIMLEKEICYVDMDTSTNNDDIIMSEKEINVVKGLLDENLNNEECVSCTEKSTLTEKEADTKQLNVNNIGIQDSVIIEEYTNSSVPVINKNLDIPVVENECPDLLFAVSFDIINNDDECGGVSPSLIEQNKQIIINDTEISASPSPCYDSIPSEKYQNLINKCNEDMNTDVNEVKQTTGDNSDLDIQDRLNMSIILLQESTAAKIDYTLNNNDKEPVKSVSDTPQYNNHISKYNHGYIYESNTNKNEKDKSVPNVPSTPLQLKRNVSCYSSNLFKDEAKPPLIPSKRTNKKKYKEKKIIENKPKCTDKINTYGILFEDMDDKDIFKTKKMKID